MSAQLPYRGYGCLAIINFLLVAGPLFIAPIPPFGPNADLVAFNTLHRNALLLGNYLGVIQLPIALLLMVFIAEAARRAERPTGGWLWLVVLGSGVCASTVGVVLAFFFTLGPLMTGLGQPALALLGRLGLFGLDISYAIQALVLGAVAVASLRLRFLPAWLGYLAWVAAILSAIGTLGLLVLTGPLSASSPVTLFAAGFSLPIWLLLAGIYWLVRPVSAPTAAVLATP